MHANGNSLRQIHEFIIKVCITIHVSYSIYIEEVLITFIYLRSLMIQTNYPEIKDYSLLFFQNSYNFFSYTNYTSLPNHAFIQLR
jgi:hypothetical protein